MIGPVYVTSQCKALTRSSHVDRDLLGRDTVWVASASD
jgi:hypothetical protein